MRRRPISSRRRPVRAVTAGASLVLGPPPLGVANSSLLRGFADLGRERVQSPDKTGVRAADKRPVVPLDHRHAGPITFASPNTITPAASARGTTAFAAA